MVRKDEIEPLEDLDKVACQYVLACRNADASTQRQLRDEFIHYTLPFAHRLSRRYRGRGESADDLEQVARLGLVKTIDRYDPQRGSFTAYAVICITGEIKRHFRNHAWGLHVPRSMKDLSLETSQATAVLTTQLARRPSTEEIAAHLRIEVTEVRNAQASAAAYRPGSLNAPVGDNAGTEMGDLLGALDRDLDLVDDRTTVTRLLSHLPRREQQMLAMRFYGNLSQGEIADELGVSQMHVSRLLARALAWLREAMLSDSLPAWSGTDDTDHRLAISIVYQSDSLQVRVAGEIDRDNADHLRTELLRAVDRCTPERALVIDLGGVPLLDAAGISVLLAVHEAVRVRGVRVSVRGLQPYVRRLAAASGLRSLVDD